MKHNTYERVYILHFFHFRMLFEKLVAAYPGERVELVLLGLEHS